MADQEPTRGERERWWNALKVAGQIVDQIGDTDLHAEAYTVCVERTGRDDGQDVSEDDYAEAFLRAVDRAAPLTMAPTSEEPTHE
jgi:hypothetical protein